MKETPLTQVHQNLGARMMEFAGYNMPVSYTSINEEHLAVRNDVGLFDVSHMGQFFIEGPEALQLLQKVSSNDASKLVVGQAQYAFFPNDKGGIVDDFITYRIEENKYMLVVNAANIQKDYDWIKQANDYNAQLTDLSDDYALLAIQGPKATEVLSKVTNTQVDQIPFYYFAIGDVCDIEDIIISATGYTGSGGYELYLKNKDVVKIWDALIKEGQEQNIKPCGLGARDTLRLEMGYCLYGHEINDQTSPIEAGLSWITKTDKTEDFYSKKVFIDQKENGVDKKLVGFKVHDKRIPREGYEIVDIDENVVGVVTSGTMSPSLNIPIGMGYVPKSMSKRGQDIGIKTRKKILHATITKLPFVKIKPT
ncbi:glycine cleavage system aminomethyltransferase GcvT [Maribacter sp.]|uniref:glycine cleavage system aminomethyltransferase GcvT n=1 Tax=Maribacter sp. TaxID=1897614 RepID=UPI0025BE49BA|nr:glycine cleavage system aminomethyltransferase GcvT [Maribacter sp.]